MGKARVSFMDAAAIGQVLDRAREHEPDIRNTASAARIIKALLKAGAPVEAMDVTRLIDVAEETGLVSRAGMQASGLYFAVHEIDLAENNAQVGRHEAMDTVHHVYLQARRALNIIHRKPGAYQPSQKSSLYRSAAAGWVPLLP